MDTTFDPNWKQFEKDLHHPDTETQVRATDAFISTRNTALQNSKKARDWEYSRREEFARNKPFWVKERKEKERLEDPSLYLVAQIKNAGRIDMTVKPAPGYILVKPIETEHKTESGLIIAGETQEPNKGTVVCVGGNIPMEGMIVTPPAKDGDLILFKRFAGIEMTIEGEQHRFMQYSDVLAVLED